MAVGHTSLNNCLSCGSPSWNAMNRVAKVVVDLVGVNKCGQLLWEVFASKIVVRLSCILEVA